jgi:serine/threonine-protein kinase
MPEPPNTKPPDGSPEPGRLLLDRFRIERAIGSGGMGDVLLAHDTLLNRPVALKRVRSDPDGVRNVRSATLREARRASQINHPRIASIYDVIELDDEVLLVMEYVQGETLRQRMKRPLTLDDFWSLATQCAEGVAAAHAHGVVHRDIKPENLMVTDAGHVKMLDFGIARRTAGNGATTTTHTSESSHRIAGTPAYMSPEAHFGNAIDERTDLFGLGIVFYEMLTARHPFAAPTYAAMLHQLLNVPAAPVSDTNPAAGKSLSDLIDRMIAKDPADRLGSASDLVDHLGKAKATCTGPGTWAPTPDEGFLLPSPTPARSTAASSRRYLVPAFAGIGLVLIAAFVWRTASAPALPVQRNLAVLSPATTGDDESDSFALGFMELLHRRLRAHSMSPGFQAASFSEGVREGVKSAAAARTILGSNLALVPTLTLGHNALKARFELFDTERERMLASREIEYPASEPFAFLDAAYSNAMDMLEMEPDAVDAATHVGIQGAGTLRFYLQGLGRIQAAKTESDALAAVEDMTLACRTEADAAVTRAGLASAELSTHLMTKDPAWLDRAEDSARESIRLGEERPETHRVLARVHATRRNHAEALVSWNRTVELDPTDDPACLRRARTLARMGDSDGEHQAYVSTMKQRPHCWTPHWWLATWHFRKGNVEDAIAHYKDMVRRAPDLYKGYSSLGGLLVLQGDYDRAIETLRSSIALRPTKIAFDNLGTAYFNSGRLDEAIAAYNQAFQFGTADYESWVNLGDAYYWLKNRGDQAADAYRQAVQLAKEEIVARRERGNSADVMIPAYLATVYPKLGQPDSARVYLDVAIEAAGSNPMVGYCAALTYWQLNQRDEAVRWLAQSVSGGYPTVWLRDSPIFEDWHEHPGYRAILEEAVVDTLRTASIEKGA